jgi:biotin carboxyl carrier protein
MQILPRASRLWILAALVAVTAALFAYFTRNFWRSPAAGEKAAIRVDGQASDALSNLSAKVLLTDQAIANLMLTAKAAHPQSHWRTIQVPGMVVDRPGQSDRSVTSPVAGVIARVHRLPGETVRPGDVLFTIRLLSESLHETQSDLFKATQDMRLAQANRERLSAAGEAIPGARLIEVDNQIRRLEVAAESARQELANRGLTRDEIERVAQGKFLTEFEIRVPGAAPADPDRAAAGAADKPATPTLEVQELKVELGQQVQSGQTLCLLADHQRLVIEGRAFRDETPLLERSIKEGWPVEVDFQEDVSAGWPPLSQTFRISHLANTIDPVNRTFAFLLPLTNQSKTVNVNGRTQMLWRFRPGQKVRLMVRAEKLDNVFVLPADAVAREGAEAFVFTQNVNTFERKPVRVVIQDRRHAVVANDGSLLPGVFVVQNVAAQLDRMAKSQSSAVPKGYHVHADGSLHKNEEEEN